MSLWTPGGEHPVDPERGQEEPPAAGSPSSADADAAFAALSPEEQADVRAMQEEMAQVRQQLLEAPAAVVVANHAMGVYELAAIHLTSESPRLAEASLAIDALAALVEGLEGRLGEAEPTLREALAHLRAAYLEVRGRAEGDDSPSPT
jgi:hypothetical protein